MFRLSIIRLRPSRLCCLSNQALSPLISLASRPLYSTTANPPPDPNPLITDHPDPPTNPWPPELPLIGIKGQRCTGCGASFQISNPTVAGYLTANLVINHQKKLAQTTSPKMSIADLEAKVSTEVVDWKYISISQRKKHLRKARHTVEPKQVTQLTCQRCHDIVRQNSTTVTGPSKITPKDMAPAHKVQRHLVIQVVDLIDFPLSHFDISTLINKGFPYLLVFNKSDLLPLSTSSDRLKQWATHFVNRMRIPKPTGIHIVSSKSGHGIAELMSQVSILQTQFSLRNVHLLGCTNAGKSEFINCLHRMVQFPKSAGKVTASRLPGTTVANIPIPLRRFSGLLQNHEEHARRNVAINESDRKLGYLHDTPGVSLVTRLTERLPAQDLKPVHWRKRLAPVMYRVPPGKSLFLGGLGRLDYLGGSSDVYRINLTVWASNTLPVHITSIEKADKFCGVVSPVSFAEDPDAVSPDIDGDGNMKMSQEALPPVESDLPTTSRPSGSVPVELAPSLNFDHIQTPAKEPGCGETGTLEEAKCEKEIIGAQMDPSLLPEILVPPSIEARKSFPQWAQAGEWRVLGFGENRAWCDFVFGGVGFVSVSGKFREGLFRVWTPGGVGAVMRDPLMPYDFGDKKITIE